LHSSGFQCREIAAEQGVLQQRTADSDGNRPSI
jgi:hypothetical protein